MSPQPPAPDLPLLTTRAALLSLGAGAAATVAIGLSPLGPSVPPLLVPRTFIDLRFVGLPLLFLFTTMAMSRARWPLPAVALPALALSLALPAHIQGSAFLDLITDLPGSDEGARVGIGRALASGVSLLLSLALALDRGRDRLLAAARAAGVPESQLAAARAVADAHAGRTLTFTASAFVALLLVARVGDALFGAARMPVAELVGAVAAVALATLLFPGMRGGLWERFGRRS